ncbi:carbohydrate kinase family protein [Oenococcus oeni]|uniref:Sugar kinase, ribokinase family n=20 Tax=Oenococcus oeni TaxID=1247 RepID=Q04DZ1_OENOB|nr:carbohydrate kinase family protein [Oenococcus oeni]EAV39261.1 ribokinase [Oenococcus oeni ATCC BAA-1163]KGO16068.1 ribokinase [Oenococcus oeni X2L]ABJ57331.1 Sugar kinase, ribokinase family [Oenococcus oeni PSU-1]EJO03418.1 ribokinase family sugar kinase [Oenococcus oeni AWRIB418]EJO04902.1 ribokinase family sugar kinase [Oenococcus oeni AWRIB548]
MNKTLVIGAAFVDVIVDVPKLPKTGDDIPGNLKSYVVGGSAFNVFGTLKHEKINTDLFVPVGEGNYANQIKEKMRELKIPIKLPVRGNDNGWDISFIEPGGERSFLTIQGIEQDWKTEWFKTININEYKYFYLSGYEMENENAGKVILKELQKRIPESLLLFDASPRISSISKTIIQKIMKKNVIINCNKEEANYFMPKGHSLEEKARRIYAKTESPVIVTLGSNGSYYYDGNDHIIPSEKKDKIINTIGAGDTHCGGILAGLNKDMSFKDSVILANRLSGLVVEKESGSL